MLGLYSHLIPADVTARQREALEREILKREKLMDARFTQLSKDLRSGALDVTISTRGGESFTFKGDAKPTVPVYTGKHQEGAAAAASNEQVLE